MARPGKAEKLFQAYKSKLEESGGEEAVRKELMAGVTQNYSGVSEACDAVIKQLKSGTAEEFTQKWQELLHTKQEAMLADHRATIERLGTITPEEFARAAQSAQSGQPGEFGGLIVTPPVASAEQLPHGNTPASSRETISAAGSKARAEEDVRKMAALVGNGTATLAGGSQVNAESLQEAIKASGVSDDNAAKLYRHAVQAVKNNDPNYFQNILDQYGGKIGVSDAEKVDLMNQVSALVELRQLQPFMERRADPPASAMRAEVQQKITSRDELNAAVGEAMPPKLASALIHDDGTLGAAIVMNQRGTPHAINLLDGLSEREKNALQTVSQENRAQEMCASDSAAPGCFVPYTPKNTPQNNR